MDRRTAAVVVAGLGLVAAASFVCAESVDMTMAPQEPVVSQRASLPPVPPSVSTVEEQVPPGTPDEPTARAALATLVRADPRPGLPAYKRDKFGGGWLDPDGNGCNGRQDVLAGWTKAPPHTGCVVEGSVTDPYTGEMLAVPDGATIDHVVALADAWRSGAADWPGDRRIKFANDPRNLIPTAGSVNQKKADHGPDAWMPPREQYWCAYARVYIGSKKEYSLTVTVAEGDALALALESCLDPS